MVMDDSSWIMANKVLETMNYELSSINHELSILPKTMNYHP
ncbi:hypothetical protein SAMN05192573_12241 [Mucilaginibacter gossypii]|uniref:Uncharacterized protein n=1 Tax=Mucilaginibacter gossypii TaxID=551996 RepID=A0A1G8L4V4_9SPHI|nr:hypothetical protein SAMN05192573_12241 [Mucilaginibacter gossypii]